MGQATSKLTSKGMSLVDSLDVIATGYILTQNFRDLERLASRDYCSRITILTADVLAKYLKEQDVKYLDRRTRFGDVFTPNASAKLSVLNTSLIDRSRPQSGGSRDEDTYYDPYGQLQVMQRDVNTWPGLSGEQKKTWGREIGKIRQKMAPRTLVSKLDVPNSEKKMEMCIGIAKFYVQIAHLFNAIAGSVNPRYIYETQSGQAGEKSLLNKGLIPKGARRKLAPDNSLCARRVDTLIGDTTKGKDGVEITRINNCGINKKLHRIKAGDPGARATTVGLQVESSKSLGDEPGIAALDDLYNDMYDYTTGRFTKRSSAAQAQYNTDLRQFYEAFTGETTIPASITKFADIPMTAYYKNQMCQDPNSQWRQGIALDPASTLFRKYATLVKGMVSFTQGQHNLLLGILRQVFDWAKDEQGRWKIATLKPDLTTAKLSELIKRTRGILSQLYIGCEKDYKRGLHLFQAMIDETRLKMDIQREKAADEAANKFIGTPPDAATQEDIEESTMENLKKAYGPPVAQVSTRATIPG
jgi:hypothetical protein